MPAISNGATSSLKDGTTAGPSPIAGGAIRPPPAATVDTVLGQVVWLMMNVPIYRHVFLADLEWMIAPAILLNQYRVFRSDNRVVAFAAWAYLSEAVEKRMLEANPRLAPAEWRSGDRLWLVSLIAPFGHQELALNELKESALAGKTFKMHRWSADGNPTIERIEGGLSNESETSRK